MQRFWRYEDGAVPNLLAITYALTAYTGGLLLLASTSVGLNLVGVFLLSHGLVIAAYLVHECAHNTLFANNRHNALLGEVLDWVTGTSYTPYEAIRHKHFRHHVDRADVVAFDYRKKLQRYPAAVKIIQGLEWMYVPAVQLMMHAMVIVLPFVMENRRKNRGRVLGVLFLRVLYFGCLIYFAPRIAIFYPIAYMLFLNVMRFMDTHQHTYEIFATLDRERGPEAKRFDAEYEQHNTFSNLISIRHPWLNLLVLNFGYHNAHHGRPTTPWYRLPALHAKLYGEDTTQILPFRNLLYAFHHYRVRRALNEEDNDIGAADEKGRHFIGVDGVSFLTTH